MNKKELKKQVSYYMSLKYPIKVSEMEEGGYFVEVIDLPGCMCDTNTLEEIPVKLEKAKKAWIEGTLERGGQVPLPKKEELYSGRFVVRIPKTLHRILSERAKQEGTSLNSYISMLLTLNSERYRTATLLWRFTTSMLQKPMKIETPYKHEEIGQEYREPFGIRRIATVGNKSAIDRGT